MPPTPPEDPPESSGGGAGVSPCPQLPQRLKSSVRYHLINTHTYPYTPTHTHTHTHTHTQAPTPTPTTTHTHTLTNLLTKFQVFFFLQSLTLSGFLKGAHTSLHT